MLHGATRYAAVITRYFDTLAITLLPTLRLPYAALFRYTVRAIRDGYAAIFIMRRCFHADAMLLRCLLYMPTYAATRR